MPIITIFNSDGQVIDREMTPDELAQWEADKAQAKTELEAKNQAALAKAAAEEKLAALGLTPTDLKALGL